MLSYGLTWPSSRGARGTSGYGLLETITGVVLGMRPCSCLSGRSMSRVRGTVRHRRTMHVPPHRIKGMDGPYAHDDAHGWSSPTVRRTMAGMSDA